MCERKMKRNRLKAKRKHKAIDYYCIIYLIHENNMISKIFFLIALILTVIWLIVFSFFNEIIYIHIVAVIAIIIFGISYVTRNNERQTGKTQQHKKN